MPDRLLVVEDEVILALDMAESMKVAHGFVIDVAHKIDVAEAMIAAHRYDYALLDLNLGLNENTLDLGADLTRQGAIVAFTSGYEEKDVHGTLGRPIVAKPFSIEDLSRALELIA